MIISKNDDQKVLPTDVIGRSVAHSKRWLVAIVRVCHEKKTSERLTKMGIENFLPVQQEIHKWSDRRKVVDRVILPMMIFVHVDPYEQKEVLTLSAISRYMVLRGESTPAVIPDQQMSRFKFMLDYSDETISMSTSPLVSGKKIRVIKGPLTGLEGELVEINGKSKVAVRLKMLGCACVDIPAGCVEPV
ncbi:UpxY family transcription antiterminator [uncultured Bacteroides sp.]|uniref:UpxY family transcription antiterminator n=1 Tax=uncultured Bacteroides sp. TaxID=162156 RepID=UPI0025E39CE3|nr:UpxY family transcription antiterminator [uncultured Bacteroides sp.]